VVAVSLFLLTTTMVAGYLYGADPALRQDVDVTAVLIRAGLELGHSHGAEHLNMLRGAEDGKLRWNPQIRHNRHIVLLAPPLGTAHAVAAGALLARAATERLRTTPPR
jgi:hypothetical protein